MNVHVTGVSDARRAQKSFLHVSPLLGARSGSLCVGRGVRTAAMCRTAGRPSVLVRGGGPGGADRWPDLVRWPHVTGIACR